MKDKNYLHNMFNATATDDGHGDIETYENWLERQLLARIEKLEQLEKLKLHNLKYQKKVTPTEDDLSWAAMDNTPLTYGSSDGGDWILPVVTILVVIWLACSYGLLCF